MTGFEAAGETAEATPDVGNPLPPGTHVVATGPGAFAQYMTMPTAGLPVPSGWSDAAALGMVLNLVLELADTEWPPAAVKADSVRVRADSVA
ncbi:hypothetical protein ABZ400_35785 [Streptomyces sp. NPDC005897]|uniref:hypothetical protein n=1 Tax=Streptomyces sp. NPDC005897 TaxID=3157081 RepID=UPI0033E1696B